MQNSDILLCELDDDGYKPVYYIPQADIRMDLLRPTGHTTRCPHKGTARYWSIKTVERIIDNAAWAYDAPLEAASNAEAPSFYGPPGWTLNATSCWRYFPSVNRSGWRTDKAMTILVVEG